MYLPSYRHSRAYESYHNPLRYSNNNIGFCKNIFDRISTGTPYTKNNNHYGKIHSAKKSGA
jgi:hypothetical protein